jgi:hypothetical protein
VQRSLDFAAWKARGVNIVMSELTLNGYLDVGVNTNIAKAQAALDAAYGRGVIRVVHAEPVDGGCACGRTGVTGRTGPKP